MFEKSKKLTPIQKLLVENSVDLIKVQEYGKIMEDPTNKLHEPFKDMEMFLTMTNDKAEFSKNVTMYLKEIK